MDPLPAALALAGLVAVSTVVGLLWRARDGSVRVATEPGSARLFSPSDFDGTVSFGDLATLVQFSTEFCARCPASERMLRSVAEGHSGVDVAVVDLTTRQDLASRFRITQTPTVLVLDRDGREHARSGGAPERAAIESVLTTLPLTTLLLTPLPLTPLPLTPLPRSNHVAH